MNSFANLPQATPKWSKPYDIPAGAAEFVFARWPSIETADSTRWWCGGGRIMNKEHYVESQTTKRKAVS